MNKFKIFSTFLSNFELIARRYKNLISSTENHRSENTREQFLIVFESLKRETITNLKGRGKFENHLIPLSDWHFPAYKYHLRLEGFLKYGIFSCHSLYKNVHWTQNLIEKYKSKIDWLLLIEESDYHFTETEIKNYYSFIPWCIQQNNKRSFIPFNKLTYSNTNVRTVYSFKNISRLSFDFITNHIEDFDLYGLCETGTFDLTPELIDVLIPEIAHRKLHMAIHCLSQNEKITCGCDAIKYMAEKFPNSKWQYFLKRLSLTPPDIAEFLSYDLECFNDFFMEEFKERKRITELLLSDNNLKNIVGLNYIKKLYQGTTHKEIRERFKDYFSSNLDTHFQDFYTIDFSIELIRKNLESGNNIFRTISAGMNRTPDTNYHFFKTQSVWEYLATRDSTLLTHDLCKYLHSIQLSIGGSHTLEDNSYKTDVIPNSTTNGLEIFQRCDVTNDEEFDKIINDSKILDFIVNNFIETNDANETWPIIDKLILYVFETYSFDDFTSLYNSIRNTK